MAMTQRAARDLIADIAAASQEGDHDTAARMAAWGVESFPDAAVFRRVRGEALAALGAMEEAKTDLIAALAVDPLDHQSLVALSRIEEAEGDLYTAAEHLLTAWEHDPANGLLRADLTYRLARLYGSEGYLQYTRPALAALYVRNAYPERAAREYAAALAEQPNRVDLRLASVLARWRLGALAEATDGCLLLLEEHPQLVRARWGLADSLARRGRGDEARDHAKRAAQLDPDGAIARAMIESNPDATIVDPDEMVRVPLDTVRSGPRVTVLDPAEIPDPVPPLPPVLPVEAATPEDAVATPPAYVPLPVASLPPAAFADLAGDAPADAPPMDSAMPAGSDADAEFSARANAELDSFEATIAALERTLAAMNARTPPAPIVDVEPPFAALPPQPEDEPEAVTATVTEAGELLTAAPGDEPLLEAAGALPAAPDAAPDPFAAPTPPAATHLAPPLLSPLFAEARAAPPPITELSTPASLAAVVLPAPPVIPAPLPVLTGEALLAGIRERAAAGDAAGAVGLGRAALAAAGKDEAQVRPLLPAMRSLVEIAPARPDARRLLGDTYRRLGQMSQAQGQYQQALLVRVAGKK